MFIMNLAMEERRGGGEETEKERVCYIAMSPVVKSRPIWHMWKLNE